MKHQTQPNLNRRQFLTLTGGATSLLLLSACVAAPVTESPATAPTTATNTNNPVRGGLLRVAFFDVVTSLDPAILSTVADVQLAFQVYANLTQRNEGTADAAVTPLLAESWEMNDNATVYTFHLRQGVTFHHGTPFTAKDVAYTVNRLLDPNLGSSAWFPPLNKVAVVDDFTIEFHLESPDVTLPYLLGGFGMGIVPHDRTTEQLAREATGAGPFIIAEHVPGERMVLKRNESYWNPAEPYLDELHLITIPEPAAQIGALTSGTVDLLHQVSLENLPALENAPDVVVRESDQGVYPVFVMRVADKPFADVRVRQAFKHAVDRPTLRQAMLQTHGNIGNDQPITPGTPFWADVAPLEYNIDKAKALLAEAGFADGLAVTLTIADLGGPRVNDAAVALQEMMKPAGITITLDKVPVNTFWAEKYMQTPFFGLWWPAYSEPSGTLPLVYTSNGIYNESGWSDPQVDELIANAQGELDREKRQQMYAEIQQIISEQGASLIPYFAPFINAARANVQGLAPATELKGRSIWLT